MPEMDGTTRPARSLQLEISAGRTFNRIVHKTSFCFNDPSFVLSVFESHESKQLVTLLDQR
jgi:hypothetical protein